MRLAEALLPTLHDDHDQAIALAQEALGAFRPQYGAAWSAGMRAKLGLRNDLDEAVIASLITDLIDLMRAGGVDYTSFFRGLSGIARADSTVVRGMFLDPAPFDAWARRWTELDPDAEAMDAVNPDLHPPQPPRRRSTRRCNPREHRPGPTASRRRHQPLRRTTRPRGRRRTRARVIRPVPDVLRHLSPLKRWAAAAAASIMLPRTGHNLGT